MSDSVVIVGGGIAGLAAADTLSRDPQRDVTVLEKASRGGGHLHSERVDGFLLEWGPHSLTEDTPALRALIAEPDLRSRIERASRASDARYIVRDGVAREVKVSPGQFVGSNLLPLPATLRALAEMVVPRKRTTDEESVSDFVTRRFGATASRVLGDALVAGIFAGDPKTLSVESCFPRIVELERTSGSVLRGMASRRGSAASRALFSLRDGVAELPRSIERRLGSRLKLGTGVTRIRREAGSWRVTTTTGDELVADAVIVATPAWDAAPLLESTDRELSMLLSQIPSVPIAVVHLGFRTEDLAQPPKGFGTLIPSSEGAAMLGVIATSNVFANRAPEGHTLVTVMMGGARAPRTLDHTDEQIIEQALAGLKRLIAPKAAPRLARVIRHPRAIPQYTLGHAARLAAIDERLRALPGLTLKGNSYRGVSVGAAVEDALKLG